MTKETNLKQNDSVEQKEKKEKGQDIEPQRAPDEKEVKPKDHNPDDFE